MTPKQEAALSYARNGRAIFPCQFITEEMQCSCGKADCHSPGKHPMWDARDLQRGRLDATDDIDQVLLWWNRWPEANIGMPMGRVNQLCALDPDTKKTLKYPEGKPGLASLEELTQGIDLSQTLVAQSGSGDGQHVLFQLLPDDFIKTVQEFRPGFDLIGDDGYVLVEPSNHISGGTYRWTNKIPPMPLPDVLRKQCCGSPEFRHLPLSKEDWVTEIHEGNPSRNVFLTRLAGGMLRARMPAVEVYRYLLTHNETYCKPPLPGKVVRTIVHSVAKREKQQREKWEKEREDTKRQDNDRTLRIYTSVELHAIKPPGYLVDGMIPQEGMTLIYGPPGAGKSLVTMDLMHAVSLGVPWHDHETKPGLVYYLAAEPGAISTRVQASEMFYGVESFPNMRYILQPANLMASEDVALLMDVIDRDRKEERVAAIVIDTLARSMIGGNENDTRDMSRFVDNVDRVARRYGATSIVIHHTGKDKDGAERGSSALRAAAGTIFKILLSPGNQIILLHEKQRDDLLMGEMRFEFKLVTLQEEPLVRSCVPERIQEAAVVLTAAAVQTPTVGTRPITKPIDMRDPLPLMRDALKNHVCYSWSQIKEAMGMDLSSSRIQRAIKDLGVIEDPSGRYVLLEDYLTTLTTQPSPPVIDASNTILQRIAENMQGER